MCICVCVCICVWGGTEIESMFYKLCVFSNAACICSVCVCNITMTSFGVYIFGTPDGSYSVTSKHWMGYSEYIDIYIFLTI